MGSIRQSVRLNFFLSDLNNNLLKYITILLKPFTLLVTLASYLMNTSHSLTKTLHVKIQLTDPLAARAFVVLFAQVVYVNAFVQKNRFIDQIK